MRINSQDIQMDVDNGADETLINKQTYIRLWPNDEPDWIDNATKLRAWGKHPIKIRGVTLVNVDYKGIQAELPIVVTDEEGEPNLLGKNSFTTFGIKLIGIQSVVEKTSDYTEMLKEFPNLLKTDLPGAARAHLSIYN